MNESCHVHVHVGDDGRKLCKYWVFADKSIELADLVGFTKRDLKRIEKVVREHINEICQTYETDCIANNAQPNYKSKK